VSAQMKVGAAVGDGLGFIEGEAERVGPAVGAAEVGVVVGTKVG
jgi:hypothetical protein